MAETYLPNYKNWNIYTLEPNSKDDILFAGFQDMGLNPLKIIGIKPFGR